MEKKKSIKNQDYKTSLTTTFSPSEVFYKISDVSEWWSKLVKGNTKTDNIFVVSFKAGDWFKIKVEEDFINKKILWNVIDAEQTWLENRKEWVDTKIVWEIFPDKNGSQVTMTHLGLVPEFECYEKCSAAWDFLLKQSLYKYLTEGAGLPA